MNELKSVRQLRLFVTKSAADGNVFISAEEQVGDSADDDVLGGAWPLSHVLVHDDDRVGVHVVQLVVVMSPIQLARHPRPLVVSMTEVVQAKQD